MTIAKFDQLPSAEKNELLGMCCSSSAWIKRMLAIFPVENLVDLLEYAEEEWYDCNPADWLEAFQHHIKIGDIETIKNNVAKMPVGFAMSNLLLKIVLEKDLTNCKKRMNYMKTLMATIILLPQPENQLRKSLKIYYHDWKMILMTN